MSSVTLLTAVMTAMIAALPATAASQEIDLSGTWKLDGARSDYGQTRPPDSATVRIQTTDGRLVLTSTQFFQTDRRTTAMDIPIDGETHAFDADGTEQFSSASWSREALRLERTAEAIAQGGGESRSLEIEVIDLLSLLDANSLQVDRTVLVPGRGEFEAKLVFARTEP